MPRLPAAAALLLAAMLLPPAAGHGADHGEELERQLVEAGVGVMVGRFDAPQDGPLVVVPHRDGPLPCAEAGAGYALALGGGAGLALLANGTEVRAYLDLPRGGAGSYAAFALDTQNAARALISMQEQAVALHRLAAVVTPPDGNVSAPAAALRTGLVGIPYTLPTPYAHTGAHPPVTELEARGVGILYDEAGPGADAAACRAPGDPGHLGLGFSRAALRASLAPGGIVHAVAIYDPVEAQPLPRPLPSSFWLQLNLYLARPGEDPAAMRAALDPGPRPEQAVALGALGLVALVAAPEAWGRRRGRA